LTDAYAALKLELIARPVVERWLARLVRRPVDQPADLMERLSERLEEHPAEPWDVALRAIVTGEAL
jgi:hypothetical protein